MDLKKVMELNELFKVCRLHNITKLAVDKLSIEFGPTSNMIPVFDEPIKETIGGELKPTAEQMLFWSSGDGIDIESKPPEI